MPAYDFRCPCGGIEEQSFSMGEAPGFVPSACCGEEARRVFTSPRLSRAGSATYQAIDAAARTADQPSVVASTSPGTSRPVAYTSNPLHQKLPRP